MNCIRIHLASITAFHTPTGDFSLFAYPAMARFIRSLSNTFPQIRNNTPSWDLNLVLNCSMKHPFEPLATCSLLDLSLKTLSGSIHFYPKGCRLGGFNGRPPFYGNHQKVLLRVHPRFLLKMSSEFHINQTIHLLVLHPQTTPD